LTNKYPSVLNKIYYCVGYFIVTTLSNRTQTPTQTTKIMSYSQSDEALDRNQLLGKLHNTSIPSIACFGESDIPDSDAERLEWWTNVENDEYLKPRIEKNEDARKMIAKWKNQFK
jgi:hypothetical protein